MGLYQGGRERKCPRHWKIPQFLLSDHWLNQRKACCRHIVFVIVFVFLIWLLIKPVSSLLQTFSICSLAVHCHRKMLKLIGKYKFLAALKLTPYIIQIHSCLPILPLVGISFPHVLSVWISPIPFQTRTISNICESKLEWVHSLPFWI